VHEFGWQLDDWDLIGTGIGVGHLLERAGQVAGGYVADPGGKDNRSYSSGRSRPMNPPP
jgi:Acyclic terpene utilisation family protein AtuA